MPRGGKRLGAGRPKGVTEIFPRGTLPALKSLTIAPKGVRANGVKLTDEEAMIADRAFQRIVDVMDERVHPSAMPSVLKAATEARSEILGERVKKIEAKIGLAELLDATLEEEEPTP